MDHLLELPDKNGGKEPLHAIIVQYLPGEWRYFYCFENRCYGVLKRNEANKVDKSNSARLQEKASMNLSFTELTVVDEANHQGRPMTTRFRDPEELQLKNRVVSSKQIRAV